MNSQASTNYTAMYNTFKTYIHGKDIDPSYDLDYKKEKEKSKTTQDFLPINETNKSNDKFIKSENNFNSNFFMNSSDSNKIDKIDNYNNDINNNKIKYEMIRNSPMQRITEVDIEKEETFQNEEPKFYDDYDEQYVKYLFNIIKYKFYIYRGI